MLHPHSDAGYTPWICSHDTDALLTNEGKASCGSGRGVGPLLGIVFDVLNWCF